MDWDKLRTFHAVAESGSLTHAGKRLNLSQSAVSRQIATLEKSVRTALFRRHARGLMLTEQGKLLYRTVGEMLSKLAKTEALLVDSGERPSGPLRVSTHVAFGATWLTQRLRAFIDLYPEIRMIVIGNDESFDISRGEADCAIRVYPTKQRDVIQRKLFTFHYHAYAAVDYVNQHGTPASVADLDRHRLISFVQDGRLPVPDVNWLLTTGNRPGHPRASTYEVNNMQGVYRAAAEGLGIAGLPDYLAREASNLVRVLPELNGPSLDAYFIYPSELRNSKRIKVFRDFLVRQVADAEF